MELWGEWLTEYIPKIETNFSIPLLELSDLGDSINLALAILLDKRSFLKHYCGFRKKILP